MQDFQKKVPERRFIYSPFVLFILFAVLILLMVSVIRIGKKQATTRETRTSYVEEYEKLSLKEGELEKKVARLETEEGIEMEIRDRFQVVKPGESLIVVVPKEEDEDIKKDRRNFREFLKDLFN